MIKVQTTPRSNRIARLRHAVGRLCVVFLLAIMVSASYSAHAQAETRTLKLYYIHTKEKASITYKKNGKYLSSGLRKINRFLRDWRRNEPTKMDPKVLDLLWEAYRATGSREHIHIVSAYRSPATNAMLRKTRGGQARKSQHMLGKAIDFYIPGVPVKKLREIGFKLGGGGVGYYPRSGVPFIHLDTGNVRSWPRMSRSELSRLFPRGGTAHLPADGKPLPGYQQALARAKAGKRGTVKIVDDTKSKSRGGGLLAGIFGGGRDEEEDAAEVQIASAPRNAPAASPKRTSTPGTLLAALPRSALPIPSVAPRARATQSAVPVAITPPAPVPVPAAPAQPEVQIAAAPAPAAPSFEPPVPRQRPAVLIARSDPPIDRRSAQELEEALLASTREANRPIEVAAAPATDGSAAIQAAIAASDTPIQPTTELAYALPIPTPAPARPSTQVAALPTPEALRPDLAGEATTEVAYAPPGASISTDPAPAQRRAIAASPSGKGGRIVQNTDATQTAALDATPATTPKYGRPTAQDRVTAQAPTPKIIPADQIDQSRFGSWSTASASLTQNGRAETRPDFIRNATRAVPTTVYTAGFTQAPPPDTNRFTGSAVTFLAVAKFDSGLGNGGDGRGEPLQIQVPN